MSDNRNSPPSLASDLLRQGLESVAASSGDPELFGVDSLLGFLLAERGLPRLIKDICEQPEALAWSAERSSLHPLGFEKLILARVDEYTLRSHIWRSPLMGDQIHNHTAPFASRILCGGYLEKRFRVLPLREQQNEALASQYSHFIYPSGRGMLETRPVLQGQVLLEESVQMPRRAGDQFVVPQTELHLTEVIEMDVPTMSCLIQAPNQTKWTDVYTRSKQLEEPSTQTFTPQALKDTLEQLFIVSSRVLG